MVFFRSMMNQQRGLPRRNQMPMRTGGNFGGGFALNPALRNLSTVMQPRFKGQGVTEADPDIIAALEVPGGGTFIGAGGRKTTVEPGYIAPPSSVKNVSQNITPQMKKQIDQELNIALNREQTGQQITNFNGENGERTFTPDDQQSTIDNAALQERLKGRYDAPGYTKGQKIAAIAGVLGDVFSAPGDRNKTATIMQTIEAQRAGDMQRQQARLADESHRSVVDSLVKSGVVPPELKQALINSPDLLASVTELYGKDTSLSGTANLGLTSAQTEKTIAGTEYTKAQIEDIHTKNVLADKQFERSNYEYDTDHKLAVQREVNERTALDIRHKTLEENIRKNGVEEELKRQAATLERRKYNEKKKEYKPDELKGAVFYNKANNAYTALDMIEKDGFSTFQFATSPEFLKSDKGRAYLAAKEEYITAVLRRESGAAIGDPEFERYNKIYFPRVGDSAKVIANKAAKRKVMLQNLALQTNGAYQDERYYVAPETQTITDILSAKDQPL